MHSFKNEHLHTATLISDKNASLAINTHTARLRKLSVADAALAEPRDEVTIR